MRLKITKIENRKFTLLGSDKKEYSFYLTFYDIPVQPKVGDVLDFDERLLDPNYEEYSPEYYFGDLASIYGRAIGTEHDADFIEVHIKRKKYYLKRFYG